MLDMVMSGYVSLVQVSSVCVSLGQFM